MRRIAKRLLPLKETSFEKRIVLDHSGRVLKKVGVYLSRCSLDRYTVKNLLNSGVIIDITPEFDVEIDSDDVVDVVVITYP